MLAPIEQVATLALVCGELRKTPYSAAGGSAYLHAWGKAAEQGLSPFPTAEVEDLALVNACLEVEEGSRRRGYDALERLLGRPGTRRRGRHAPFRSPLAGGRRTRRRRR